MVIGQNISLPTISDETGIVQVIKQVIVTDDGQVLNGDDDTNAVIILNDQDLYDQTEAAGQEYPDYIWIEPGSLTNQSILWEDIVDGLATDVVLGT